MMIRAHKTKFFATKYNIDRLFECNRISGDIWNDVLEIAKFYYVSHGKWVNKTQLQAETKGNYPIHSQSIQAVCHKYLFSRDAAKKARDKGFKDTKYPYKKKKHFNTKWVDLGYKIYENGKIELSLGRGRKPIIVWVKPDNLPEGKIKEIELSYDNGLLLSMSYDDGKEEKENTNTNRVAIDPGEIHSISAFAENGQATIITGRKVRSIKRLRNKKLGELQKKMSKCKKGSKKWKKYNRVKRYILLKSGRQLKDALHKTTRQFVEWCKENEIKEVAIGDVEGVQRNTSKRKKNKKKRRSRKTNQKTAQWHFGQIYKYLEYKLHAEGMSINKQEESYTSQTCPVCGKKKKVSSRNYKCKCGYECHRDIHGARNILSKYIYKDIRDLKIDIENITYLRIA
ncbi:RNA-guided endonuclease InsQ/TnpB family protein [Paraliobacillus quinghaiensis]|nr:RNA-guided endonuclease TnpB family protein [Paraliobacillus quinghaiensis]